MRSSGTVPPRRSDGAGFGVYVHWPFCLAKCPYCDFNSHVRGQGIDEPRFLRAYLAELDHMAALAPDRAVASVFLGGGTPSLMSPETVGRILDHVARRWQLAPDAEVTLEANPTSVEAGRFAGYRAAGVNRVSLGMQALDDGALRALGRLHPAAEAVAALDVAKAHFDRVSFDLIYARPGQTVAAWRAELARAVEIAPGHLSLYQLTIEPDTTFAALHAAGRLAVPGDGVAAALYETTQALLEHAGLAAYEVSNHARPGEACRHNLVYWRSGAFAGVGPGAHGRLEIDGRRHALAALRDPEAWRRRVEARGHGLALCEPLGRAAQADELLVMGLRLDEGIDLDRSHAIRGRRLEASRLEPLLRERLIECDGPRLRVTARGRPVLDAVIGAVADAIGPDDSG